ncbi:MAG: hypothetical protein CMJ51_01560 [Planctomycetaceae bacterium]|nr:hypothetical protein [Planctomycetaceae bacterium]
MRTKDGPDGDEARVADQVVIVFEERRGTRTVKDCCFQGRRLGVRAGMVVAEARALVGERPLLLARGSARRVAAALKRLAERSLRFAPTASIDGADGIILDIRGCERWLAGRGGETGLLDRIGRVFRGAGFEISTAIADTPIVARGWCRHRPGVESLDPMGGRNDDRVLPVGVTMSAIDPLPVECLGLDDQVVERLREVRVRRVAELRRLPRMALPSRYGPSILHRLDQVTGRVATSMVPVRPAEAISIARNFEGPVRCGETIELVVVDLLAGLHERLAALGRGARMLRLRATIPDSMDWIETVELARATRRPGHLWAVLEPVLRRLPLDDGIDRIGLEVPLHRRLGHRTRRLLAAGDDSTGGDDPESRAAFVDLIQARFGRESIRCFSPRPGHVPEDQNRLIPVGDLEDASTREVAASMAGLVGVPGSRPTVWLDRPESIEVRESDDRIVAVRWRDDWWPVVTASGPESIGAPWWRRLDVDLEVAVRDYWRVTLENVGDFWIFRAASRSEWYLQGAWA